MKRLSILLCTLVAALPLAAQEGTWTLAKCIDHAIANNLGVRQGASNVEENEIAVHTARSARLPGVYGSASQNFSFGRGLTADNTYANTNTTSTGFSVGAEMPLFQGFRIKHDIALKELNLAAATAELERVRDNIRTAVAAAYVQILYNREILGVAREQVAIDSLQVERLGEMLANGRVSASEYAQQKAALAQSRYQLTQAENNLQLSRLDLAQLLELPSPEGFRIAVPGADETGIQLLPSPEAIYADAVGERPAILAEEKRLDAAEKQIDLAKSALYPSLSLSGGIGSNFYTSSGMSSPSFTEQMKNNFSQSVGLSLSIPIFNRFSTRNSIRSAQLGRENQQLQLETAKKSLYKEIQQAWYSAVAAQERFRSSEEVVASARESFELVSAKYENGKANITEFNESKNNLVRAESDLAQARWQQVYQTRLLEFYRGGDLVF